MTALRQRQRRPRRALVRIVGLAVGALLAVGFLATPTAARVGVSIEPGELSVSDPIAAGASINLPPLTIRNPGDEPTSYVMAAEPLAGTPAEPAPSEWFTFEPSRLELTPGATATTTVTINPGSDAAAGRYAVVLRAEIASTGTGTQVGAAAGARVFFDVTAAPAEERSLLPWILAGIAALLVLAVAITLLVRRSRRRRAEKLAAAIAAGVAAATAGTAAGTATSGPAPTGDTPDRPD